jgi:hypothetical protein
LPIEHVSGENLNLNLNLSTIERLFSEDESPAPLLLKKRKRPNTPPYKPTEKLLGNKRIKLGGSDTTQFNSTFQTLPLSGPANVTINNYGCRFESGVSKKVFIKL